MSGSIWRVDHPVAYLRRGDFQATVNLLTPRHGLERLRFAATPQSGAIQRVIVAAETSDDHTELHEAYVRGADLIAVYTQAQGQPFRTQVYWRAAGIGDDHLTPIAIDAMVSLETHVLECRPAVTVETAVSARDVWTLDGQRIAPGERLPRTEAGADRPHGFLIRLADVDRCLALMAWPHDGCAVSAQWAADGSLRVAYHLPCDPLEKGVILRARVRSVLGHGDVDCATALAWYDALIRERPPLTT